MNYMYDYQQIIYAVLIMPFLCVLKGYSSKKVCHFTLHFMPKIVYIIPLFLISQLLSLSYFSKTMKQKISLCHLQ